MRDRLTKRDNSDGITVRDMTAALRRLADYEDTEEQGRMECNVVHCRECRYAVLTYDGKAKYCKEWSPHESVYLDGDYFCASGERRDRNTDTEGICPVCGGVIIYNGGMDIDDSGCTYPWECVYCGATGKEGFDFRFDRHYDVQDAQGHPIPGRPE